MSVDYRSRRRLSWAAALGTPVKDGVHYPAASDDDHRRVPLGVRIASCCARPVGARRRERRRQPGRQAPRCACFATSASAPRRSSCSPIRRCSPSSQTRMPHCAPRSTPTPRPTVRARRRARHVRELPRRSGRRRTAARGPRPRDGRRSRAVPADAHDQRRGRRAARLGRAFAATLAAAGRDIEVLTEPGTRHGHLNRPEEAAARGIHRSHRRPPGRPASRLGPHIAARTHTPRCPSLRARPCRLASPQTSTEGTPHDQPAAADLIARSNRLGADPKNTNYAGGNTSAKGTETDPVTGEPVELLWVKGSGGDLGTLTEAGPRRAAPRPHARAR